MFMSSHRKIPGEGNRHRAAAGTAEGELGFVTPNNKRTQTVECVEDGAVMTITYDRLLEVYFDNPDFAISPAPVERPPAAEHGAHGSDH